MKRYELRDIPHADKGLQPERTTLSWNRTILALVVLAAAQLRFGQVDVEVEILAVLIAIPVAITAARRYLRQSQGITAEQYQPETNLIFLTGLTVCAMAAVLVYQQLV